MQRRGSKGGGPERLTLLATEHGADIIDGHFQSHEGSITMLA